MGKLSLTVKVGPTSFHVALILSVGEIPKHLLCDISVSVRMNTGALLCTYLATFHFKAWCIVVMPSLHFNYNILSWNKVFQLIMYASELLVTVKDIEIQVFCDVMPCLWVNIAKEHITTPLGLG
jgi:hypothetical protein